MPVCATYRNDSVFVAFRADFYAECIENHVIVMKKATGEKGAKSPPLKLVHSFLINGQAGIGQCQPSF